MPIIDPCHRCGTPVYHNDSTAYLHNILCEPCKAARQEERYANRTKVAKNLIDHAREHDGDCGDPDCELHSPWVIEDENERMAAIAWWICGAKAASSDVEETLHGALEAKLSNIADEALAPEHPGSSAINECGLGEDA